MILSDLFKKKVPASNAEEENIRGTKIRISKKAYRKILFKRIGAITLSTLVGIFIVYLGFSATILRVVFNPNSGPVLIKETTYPGGNIPENSKILINASGEIRSGVLDRMLQGLIPQSDSATVLVLAGPYGTISPIAKGSGIIINGDLKNPKMQITVSGKEIDIIVPKDFKETRLNQQYFGVCISGACSAGDGIIFSKNSVYGSLVENREKR